MARHARTLMFFVLFLLTDAKAMAERLVLAAASYGRNIVAICDAEGKLLWSHHTDGPKSGHAGHHDIQLLDNGNILFHENWTTIVEMNLQKKVVWSYDAGTMNGNLGKRVEVHAFQRLPNGMTMIAESGVGRIIEVDQQGKIHAEVKLQGGGRQHTRLVRKLANGNYLVCAESPGVVTEYNAKSEVVWERLVNTRVYGAIRLRNGNTLIASGSGASVVEVTPEGKTVWEIKDTVPGAQIELKWTTFLTELDNGNFIVGNCHAGAKNPQIFEITRRKEVIWRFNQYGVFGDGLACSQILSDDQAKLVRRSLAALVPQEEEKFGAKRTAVHIGSHDGFVLQPVKPPAEGGRPWVWYAPTLGTHPNQSNEWALRQLLDRGFHVCGVDVGESYGSPLGRKVYSEFHRHVVERFKLDAKARLLAQSRGGLMLYNWAADNPEKVQCIVGIYPVCDLRSYPGLRRAAQPYRLTPDELQAQLTQHNPIDRLAPLAKAGVPILHLHGDADQVVPLEKNSQIIADRYRSLGGQMMLIIVPGKGHAEIPEYFQDPRLVQFLLRGGFSEELPPPLEGKVRILKTFAEEFVELTPGVGKHPASFTMGSADGPASEGPSVQVTFASPFALARYETTQELYEAVIGRNPSRWKGHRHAVERVSWDDANEFCRIATSELRKLKLIGADELIRLPSEAEWEYACRAGTISRFSFGPDAESLDRFGWHSGNSKGNDPPVGSKKPNPWGFFDMHGYVWEWCADAWAPTHLGASTAGMPREMKAAKERVLRGGSWADDPDLARSASRRGRTPDFRSDAVGFRCVRAKQVQ